MPTDKRRPRRVDPIYRTRDGASEILLYGGPVEVETPSGWGVIEGQVELCLFPRSGLVVHVAGPASAVWSGGPLAANRSVRLPTGASLAPPAAPTLPLKPDSGSWGTAAIRVGQLDVGKLSVARRFVIHLSNSVRRPLLHVLPQTADGTYQNQVSFELDGWQLVLVAQDRQDDAGFGAVIEATPTTTSSSEAVEAADVEALAHRLFVLLSFVSNREVGVGPICGVDDENALVWARWTSPRLRGGRAPVGWCARHVMPHALQALANNFTEVPHESPQEAVVERAVNYLLFADSDEVLDVRVTMACAGLELLSWAVLREQGWLRQETTGHLASASAVRLLMQWAQLNVDLPGHFVALIGRRGRLGDPTLGAAELIFNVRNRVIHPPKKLDDPEWPEGDELFEAWQLATWALELVLLRLLNYRGAYWSRLHLPRSAMDVQAVPWATGGAAPDV